MSKGTLHLQPPIQPGMYEITPALQLGPNKTGPGWALYKPAKGKKSAKCGFRPFQWYAKPEQALDTIVTLLIRSDGSTDGSHDLEDLIARVRDAAKRICAIRADLNLGRARNA